MSNEEIEDDAFASSVGSVKTITSNESIDSVCGAIRKNRYDLTPDWQREFVWKPEQQSALIESILLGMPIPSIFIFEDSTSRTSKKEVIDGKQRLTTISEFQNGNFELCKLSVLSHLNGKSYSQLSEEEQSLFDDYKLNVNLISSDNHDLKFRMFERLNTGGTVLNPQEIRNCVYRGPLNELIMSLSKDSTFSFLMNRKTEDKRKEDESYILSFAAFRDFLINKTPVKQGGLKQVLNDYMRSNCNANDGILSEIAKDFKNSIECTKIVLSKTAFRKFDVTGGYADRTNVILFRIQLLSFIGVNPVEVQLRADALREKCVLMLKDKTLDDLISKATGNFDRTKMAFNIWKTGIDSILSQPVDIPGVFSNATKRISFDSSIKEILFNKSNVCSVCGNKILSTSSGDCHIDHIIPLSVGGTNDIENLQLLHPICNQKKSNKLFMW